MATMYRKEPDLPISVHLEDVVDAKCGDFTRCTLAQAGKRAVGVEIDVGYSYELKKVRVNWKSPDGRRHRGVLLPDTDAMELLFLTDQNKQYLVRKFRKGEVRDLVIAEHESRNDYTARQAQYAENKREKLEAERLRVEQGEPVPPKKQRKARDKSATPSIRQRVRVTHSELTHK